MINVSEDMTTYKFNRIPAGEMLFLGNPDDHETHIIYKNTNDSWMLYTKEYSGDYYRRHNMGSKISLLLMKRYKRNSELYIASDVNLKKRYLIKLGVTEREGNPWGQRAGLAGEINERLREVFQTPTADPAALRYTGTIRGGL